MRRVCFGVLRRVPPSALLLLLPTLLSAQDSTHIGEDRLASEREERSTIVSGYGNVLYRHDGNASAATMNLERTVLFVGHRFTPTIAMFTELEVEDAKLEGGDEGGEVAIEQAYVRFDLNAHHALVAGLFIPRIGILNEDHLPTNFHGNERPVVETLVIPATWREIGIGWYATFDAPRLQCSFAIVNGLSSSRFEHGTLLREGRAEGRHAPGSALAITGSARMDQGPFRIQCSGYYGGSAGLPPREADSLRLTSGPFGTPVALGEADIRLEQSGLSLTLLGCLVAIPDAAALNRAYGSNTPEQAYGLLAEVAYDLFTLLPQCQPARLLAFARWERLNLNARIPVNGLMDGTLDQSHVTMGLTFLPIPNIAVKADVRLVRTGDPNPALISGPDTLPFHRSNTIVTVGMGYAF